MNVSLAIIGMMTAVCVFLPIIFAWKLWRLDEPSLSGWLLAASSTTVFSLLILLVGRWDIAGIWTRLILVGLIAIAALGSLTRHIRRPWRVPRGSQFLSCHLSTALSLILFGAALAYVLTGFATPKNARDLAFPLRGGHFVIAHGGSIGMLNHHASHPAQRYALDITATNSGGFRSMGILPSEPARYVIFGASVVSPCDGSVISVEDGLPDSSPPEPIGPMPPATTLFCRAQGCRLSWPIFNKEVSQLGRARV